MSFVEKHGVHNTRLQRSLVLGVCSVLQVLEHHTCSWFFFFLRKIWLSHKTNPFNNRVKKWALCKQTLSSSCECSYDNLSCMIDYQGEGTGLATCSSEI